MQIYRAIKIYLITRKLHFSYKPYIQICFQHFS
nr:MAG TPA: hypothetical protein [Caudoviricetes sp.]